MREIAWKGLRGRKKETKLLIGMLVIIYTCSFMLIVFQESYMKTQEKARYSKYGEWEGAVYNADKNIKKILGAEEDISMIGTITTDGTILEEGKARGRLGTVDKNAVRLGHIELEKGKMPDSEREVAVTDYLLEYLPADTKIGNTISLTLQKDNAEVQEEFVLTGIVKPWGDRWEKAGFSLPNAVTGENLREITERQTHYFFKFSHIRKTELMRLKDTLANEGGGVYTANKALSVDNTSAMAFLFKDGRIMLLIIIISIILIGYMLSISVKRQKYSVTVLRGIGASAGQVINLVLWEGVIIWGAAVIMAVILGAAGTFVILNIAKLLLEIPVYCAVNWGYIAQEIIFTTVAFFIGKIYLTIQSSNSNIGASFREDSADFDDGKKLVLKKAENLTLRRIFKRNRIFYKNKIYLRMGISLVVIVVSAITIQSFIKAEGQYRFWREQTGYEYGFTNPNLPEGVSLEEIEEIKKIPGITQVSYGKYINRNFQSGDIKVQWSGWKKSDYVKTYRRYTQEENSNQPYDKNGDYFTVSEIRGVSQQDYDDLAYYENMSAGHTFNREQFEQGNECVLFLPPYQLRDRGYETVEYRPVYVEEKDADKGKKLYKYEDNEHSIQPGDTVRVSSPWGQSDIKVGGIIRDVPPVEENVIAVEEKFLDKLCGTDGLYNDVQISYSENADFEKTDRLVEAYFTNDTPQNNFSNSRIIYQEITRQNLSEMFQCIVILGIIWLLYFLVMYQGNTGHMQNERRRVGILCSLGISRFDLKMSYFFEYALETIKILSAGMAVLALWFSYKLRTETSYDSVDVFIKEIANSKESIETLGFALLIATAIFLGVYFITIYTSIKGILKNSAVTNIRSKI